MSMATSPIVVEQIFEGAAAVKIFRTKKGVLTIQLDTRALDFIARVDAIERE